MTYPTSSSYDNPFAEFSDAEHIFRSDLAVASLIEVVLDVLPVERREPLNTDEARAGVQQYVTTKMDEQNFVRRMRKMMYDHIIDWKLEHGINPHEPAHTSRLDRIADALHESRARERARVENWHLADTELVKALSIRSHVIAGILRSSNDMLSA